jgi:hypothetical protein
MRRRTYRSCTAHQRGKAVPERPRRPPSNPNPAGVATHRIPNPPPRRPRGWTGSRPSHCGRRWRRGDAGPSRTTVSSTRQRRARDGGAGRRPAWTPAARAGRSLRRCVAESWPSGRGLEVEERRRVGGGPGGCNWENERDFRVWVGGYMVRCGDKIAYFLFYLVAQACLDFKTFKIYRHIESLTYVEYIKSSPNIKFLPKILSVVTTLSWNR